MDAMSPGDRRREAAKARAAAERWRQGLPAGAEATIGIIGGSGLDQLDGLREVVRVRPETPFGLKSISLE